MLDSFCVHKFHASGGMKDEVFKDAVLSGLMRSSAQSSELLPYSIPVSAHLKHGMFSESEAQSRSRALQKGEIWAMMESRKHSREAAAAPVRVHSPPLTLLRHRLSLSYTYTVPSITGRGLTEEKRIIAKIKATTQVFTLIQCC